MALTGTLRDFGIADILQLIGQQGKTGILHLKNKEKSVHVHFVDGNVVKAESATRSRKDLLGSLMVRAGILSQEQLDRALEIQKQTLRRLGDILVDEKLVTRELFREMYQLQTTETLYRLFHWKDGTYEFEQVEVDYDREAITPIRSENVLMEGFRMVDEWPMVRKKITSYDMTFVRRRSLAATDDAPRAAEGGDEIDAAFGALEGEAPRDGAPPEDLGPFERKVFELAEPQRTVQEIIDLSRMGEFETCKSLLNLVDAGYLEPVAPKKKGKPLAGARGGMLEALGGVFVQALMGVIVLGLVAGATYLGLHFFVAPGTPLRARAVEEVLAGEQAERIARALEVYRVEEGRYPETLGQLQEAGLLSERDGRYPYGRPWYYRPPRETGDRYTLLPPIP